MSFQSLWLRNLSIALLLLAFLNTIPCSAQSGKGLSPVVVSPVVVREVSVGQTFVGTVKPSKTAIIGSAVSGRVVEFPVNEGDRVKKGATLSQLLTATITLELESAKAKLNLKQEELKELKNGSRKEEKERAKAKMTGAEARNKYVQSRKARVERLFKSGRVATEADLDEVISAADAAEQALVEAKAAYQLVLQGPRVEIIAQSTAEVAMQQAVVDKLKDQIKKYTITTRFAGYVTAEHTEVGQWVKVGDPVVEVIALDEVEILVHVLEKQIPFVKKGISVRIEIPALPERLFTGKVLRIIPQADTRTHTFPVKVQVTNIIDETTGPVLKSGMFARVMLPTRSKTEAMLVPKDALVLGGKQTLVYVVDTTKNDKNRGHVRSVAVELGVADGHLIQVKGDIEAGQLVVVLGNERLRSKQEVRITGIVQPSTAARAPTSPKITGGN